VSTIEGAVVAGLKSEMRNPALVAEYAKAYHDERTRLAAEVNSRRNRLERRLADIDAESERIVDFMVKSSRQR
jgi:hypothetical protein